MRLTLPLPPSANSYWRHVGNRVLLSKEARLYRGMCELAAVAQWKGAPLEGPVRIHADVYMADKRGDLMNREKQLLDAIQGVVMLNDSQVVDMRMVRHLDKLRPRVELTVESVTQEKP